MFSHSPVADTELVLAADLPIRVWQVIHRDEAPERAAAQTRSHTTRQALKQRLSMTLQVATEDMLMATATHGKPRLLPPHDHVSFSVSHSHDFSLFAISETMDIGIDVEQHETSEDVLSAAAMVFSAREKTHLSSLPLHQQHALFYRLWCHKEALLKLTGAGFSMPPETLCLLNVVLGNSDAFSLSGNLRRVRFFEVDCGPDATAVLAYTTKSDV